MKRIIKSQPPQSLIAWTRTKAVTVSGTPMAWGYNDMDATLRETVKTSLIKEQGGLCCYTGRRIALDTSHIEHLKPQEQCVNHEDTDYANLLAAYPSANAHRECEYGAHCKKNWYDQHLFVHPLRHDCEVRLRYRNNGSVVPVNPADQGATETIKRLNLDAKELRDLRKQAIEATLFEEELSKGDVQRLRDAMDQRFANGSYREFCFVIKQACERYLKGFQ